MPVGPADGEEAGGPFDPESEIPTLAPPSSEAPDATDAPGVAMDVSSEDAEPQEEIDPLEGEELPEFDPKFRTEFEGLLFLGKLERDFQFLGHKFRIRTLLVDEVLEIGLLQQPYVGSLGEMKAYQAAVCAAVLVTVDGKPLPQPLSMDSMDTNLRNRFEYVKNNWFPPVLDVIYQQYLLLEITVSRVMEALGEA